MKYLSLLALACIFFAQCTRIKYAEPTGHYDTLGIRWSILEGTNITYYFQDFDLQSFYAGKYVEAHEEAYVTINKEFNAKQPAKLRFFVWADTGVASQALGRSLGFAVPLQCVCHVFPTQTLGHEITHILSHWSNGVPPTKLTRFVNEGVAVAFDLRQDDKIATAKEARAGHNISSVTEFWSGSQQTAHERLFYPVAGAFMEFLYKKNLPGQFHALLKNQTIESAENIYGKEQLGSFITEFNALVGL